MVYPRRRAYHRQAPLQAADRQVKLRMGIHPTSSAEKRELLYGSHRPQMTTMIPLGVVMGSHRTL